MVTSATISMILKIITALQIPGMVKEILKKWVRSKPEPKDPLKIITTILAVVASVVSLVAAAKKLMPEKEDIKPNTIYTPDEVAKLLRIEMEQVVNSCNAGILKATKLGEEYRIKGKAILEFMDMVNEA